jgi:hypothetical protein
MDADLDFRNLPWRYPIGMVRHIRLVVNVISALEVLFLTFKRP